MTSNRPWRLSTTHDIHVYSGTRPVATFHSPGDAAYAVSAVNAYRQPPEYGDYWHTAEQLRNIDRKLEQIMTQASDNQTHLESDVAAINQNVATAVAELKAQIAAGTPAESLDFTSLDSLSASTGAEAAADAPPAPAV